MAIKLQEETKKQVITSIKRYFSENLDDDIGNLKADLLLDYFLREIGPTIYNQAILDAQAYFQEKTSDLDAACLEVEFGYWK
jgi:uncharacterized protein (DUF2164 family)